MSNSSHSYVNDWFILLSVLLVFFIFVYFVAVLLRKLFVFLRRRKKQTRVIDMSNVVVFRKPIKHRVN